MSSETIGTITANCGNCGSAEMSYDEALGEAAEITCASCGAHLGTLRDFRDLAEIKAGEAFDQVTDALRKALKF